MSYDLYDLIDVEKTRELLEDFHRAVGVPAAIIDLKGVVLASSHWQRVCTDFHRVNEITYKRCIESDTLLANQLLDGKTFSLYRCRNGLMDAASPIRIEGEHLANMFTGQFLTEPPDLEFFRRQAEEFGFDKTAYLEAVAEVPMVQEKALPGIMSFLTSLAEMIASLGLKQRKIKESEQRARDQMEKIENLARFPDQNPSPVLRISREGELLYANQSSAGILRSLGWERGVQIPDKWRDYVREVFHCGDKREIEIECEAEVYLLLFVPFPELGI